MKKHLQSKQMPRLKLTRETVRVLSSRQTTEVRGGGGRGGFTTVNDKATNCRTN